MVCAPVRSIIPSLKLGDYLSVQAHKPCSISHLSYANSVKPDHGVSFGSALYGNMTFSGTQGINE